MIVELSFVRFKIIHASGKPRLFKIFRDSSVVFAEFANKAFPLNYETRF